MADRPAVSGDVDELELRILAVSEFLAPMYERGGQGGVVVERLHIDGDTWRAYMKPLPDDGHGWRWVDCWGPAVLEVLERLAGA